MFADSNTAINSSSGSDSGSLGTQNQTLQQQIDSFLTSHWDAGQPPKDSTVPAPGSQRLASLLSRAAAADAEQQERAVDPALSSGFLTGQQHAWRNKQSGKPLACAAERQLWFAAAVAQWRILEGASNANAAQLLLGAGAVPQEYLRLATVAAATAAATEAA
jgi:hypothetical protein